MEQNSHVSIIIPTYNRKDTLADTINSVINQTYKDWELIIVDDMSTDNTKELILCNYCYDKRIRYLENRFQKGPSGARNYGISCSQGEVIAFLDSDDQWTSNHLLDSIKAINDEHVDVCFSLWYEKDKEGNIKKIFSTENDKIRFEQVVKELKPKISENKFIFNSNFFEYTTLYKFYCCHINTMVLKKEIIKSTGTFNEKLHGSEDVDFILNIVRVCGFCLLYDYHLIYNQGPDNLYYFINRRDIHLHNIIRDRTIVEKLSFCDINYCEMLKIRMNVFKNSYQGCNKWKCIKACKRTLAKKYFTLGMVNQKINRIKSVCFLFNSLLYDFHIMKIVYIFKLIFSLNDKVVEAEVRELNFL